MSVSARRAALSARTCAACRPESRAVSKGGSARGGSDWLGRPELHATPSVATTMKTSDAAALIAAELSALEHHVVRSAAADVHCRYASRRVACEPHAVREPGEGVLGRG